MPQHVSSVAPSAPRPTGPDLAALDDVALLALIAVHDEPTGRRRAGAALHELHRRHAGAIARTVRAQGAGASRVDDALQETFVRVWRNAHRFDPTRGTAAAWLRTIARRALIDLVRAEQRSVPTTGLDESTHAALSGGVPAEDRWVLDDALAQLSAEHRQVLTLAYADDLSQRQIASHLQVPLGTVKTRTHWALTAMRRHLAATYVLQPA
jgi:RNA polymerase sigma-70 factor (ECF subfamily)